MRPLFVSATKQDTGKTTVMIGLLAALRAAGYNVGYMKPVGQRCVQCGGLSVDANAILARQAFGLEDDLADMSPIAVEHGFTERYIHHPDPKPLEDRILSAFGRLRAAHPMMAVEGSGHAGVGSCFDLSNARVAELLGAAAVIVTEGGIGRAIDEAALSLRLFERHGVPLIGVIMNKVHAAKAAKIRDAVALGLAHLGTRLIGVVPYRGMLVPPHMQQVVSELGARLISGEHALTNRVDNTVVAAMTPPNLRPLLRNNTLVIAAGDRDDILSLLVRLKDEPGAPRISGVLLTGDFEPSDETLGLLRSSGLPAALCAEPIHVVAARLGELQFRTLPDDVGKIAAIKTLVRDHVDMDALLAGIEDDS